MTSMEKGQLAWRGLVYQSLGLFANKEEKEENAKETLTTNI